MKKKLIFISCFLLFYCNIFSWYSQLFPFNSGSYDEATINFNGRNWRILDYAYVGYKTGSIPLRNGIPCNIITITGTGDITVELQQAIDNVGAAGGGIVRIPVGTYTITEHSLHGGLHPIGVNYNNVSIEGAGSGRTIINIPPTHVYSNDSNAFEGVFTFEKSRWAWNKGWVDRGAILSMVTNVIPEGSMYVTGLTNSANVNTGDWIVIQQYWWQEFSQQNSGGVWQYYPPNYNREMSFTYLRQVTNKDTGGIYLNAPIPFHLDPANNPIHIKRSGSVNGGYSMLENVGISGLTIIFQDNVSPSSGRPEGAAIAMEGVMNAWIRDVQVYNFPRFGFYFEYDANITVMDCAVKKSQDYGGDGYGYGYHIHASQNMLVKNCYAEDMRHAYIFQKSLSNYCVITNCDAIDVRQGEDTHHSFCHAILRDDYRMSHGNKLAGLNRGTTSTNAFETLGTGVLWNSKGDDIGGVWYGAQFDINPAPYPSPYTHGIMIGGPGLYKVYDNSTANGTYVRGDQINANPGLQVGINGDRNMLYEGLYNEGLQPVSLYDEQLKNRLGTISAVWDNTCGTPPALPLPTATPSVGPGILIYNSDHAAWGTNWGSGCPQPLNTLTPGCNLDDMGQNHTGNGSEGIRFDTTGSTWTPFINFGGPDLSGTAGGNLEMWVWTTNTSLSFYVQMRYEDTDSTLGSAVTVDASMVVGGSWVSGAWNRVVVPISAFGYSGTYNGFRFSRTSNTTGTFYIDDIYITGLSGTPTFTSSRTPTFYGTASYTVSRTLTLTSTYTRTLTRTNTQILTNTYTETPTYTRTNTSVATNTFTGTGTNTPTWTRTATWTFTRTSTQTNTPSMTSTLTRTGTPTLTISPTHSVSPTITQTWTGTPPSPTNTPTVTSSSTITITFTRTMTGTPTGTWTNTYTTTATRTSTLTWTFTVTLTSTRTSTPTFTVTDTISSNTPTGTPTLTGTYTITSTFTWTRTLTQTFTHTSTMTWIQTFTQTAIGTVTKTVTTTQTTTNSPHLTMSFTATTTQTTTSNQQPAITNVVIYPNPCNTGEENLKINFELTGKCKLIKVKIYTSGFRLIKQISQEKDYDVGKNKINIERKYIEELSNGIYYLIMEGTDVKDEKLISKPAAAVILR
ncbi:MAG: right-handed parallel beta-helix repeat-containing protein [Candidatus Goldbacteria bacterium]|nr:right-handed parallel beta-helix repeat-containing protein [Candidatus Goldiibacteriota bacterium]